MGEKSSGFSFSDWQDAMDVGANPVENKLRRDWLSRLLVEQMDGYEPNDGVDESEFLDHYADAIFLDCLRLNRQSPFATLKDGRFSVAKDAGWAIKDREFGNAFNNLTTGFARHFQQWLEAQEENGQPLKDQLLSIYCNGGDAELRKFQIDMAESLITERSSRSKIKPS